jgi:hypothetical protein
MEKTLWKVKIKTMNIDESTIIKDVDEESALACLLVYEQVLLSVINVSRNDNVKEYTTCIYVNANDVFAWACADGECITNNDGDNPSEIIELYKLWKENERWGTIKWLCKKRNLQPQYPIKKDIMKDGYWDEQLNTLPLNPSDPDYKNNP